MSKSQRVTFVESGGGDYEVLFVSTKSRCLPDDLDGATDLPSKGGQKRIFVDKALRGQRKLEVILHETAHAADPRASEEAIEEQAREQARLLWSLGLRWK